MSMLDSVAVLIDCAKRLRGIAEGLDAGDIKSQIVDELFRLHEIRETLLLAGNNGGTAKPASPVGRITAEPVKQLVDANSKSFTFEADEVTETYDLHQEAQAAARATATRASTEAAAGDPATESATKVAVPKQQSKSSHAGRARSANSGTSDTEILRASETTELPASPAEMTEEQRVALAEERILELEPLHQAALRRMNEVLSEEQRQTKAAATRAGIKAGQQGRELQQSVMAALHLTPDQQQRLAAARKELLEVRQAIARQVEGLLSKEQLDLMLQQFAKKHGG